ncbi:MAG: hypothetical protein ISR65_10870 [Bacteriovoracaceae bacterium]|nr:hypothetical protein [Bacteriovoracaceae bacterium]
MLVIFLSPGLATGNSDLVMLGTLADDAHNITRVLVPTPTPKKRPTKKQLQFYRSSLKLDNTLASMASAIRNPQNDDTAGPCGSAYLQDAAKLKKELINKKQAPGTHVLFRADIGRTVRPTLVESSLIGPNPTPPDTDKFKKRIDPYASGFQVVLSDEPGIVYGLKGGPLRSKLAVTPTGELTKPDVIFSKTVDLSDSVAIPVAPDTYLTSFKAQVKTNVPIPFGLDRFVPSEEQFEEQEPTSIDTPRIESFTFTVNGRTGDSPEKTSFVIQTILEADASSPTKTTFSKTSVQYGNMLIQYRRDKDSGADVAEVQYQISW